MNHQLRPATAPIPTDPVERRRIADEAAEAEFRRRPFGLDESDDRADAVSLAWEDAIRYGRPWKCAKKWAFINVRSDRRTMTLFPESARSVTSTHRYAVKKLNDGPRRSGFFPESVLDPYETPENEAALRVDVQAWLSSIPRRHQVIVLMTAEGYLSYDIAKEIGVGASQVRNLLVAIRASWEHFTSLCPN